MQRLVNNDNADRERDELIESSCRTKLVDNLMIDRLYAMLCVPLPLEKKGRIMTKKMKRNRS